MCQIQLDTHSKSQVWIKLKISIQQNAQYCKSNLSYYPQSKFTAGQVYMALMLFNKEGFTPSLGCPQGTLSKEIRWVNKKLFLSTTENWEVAIDTDSVT